jgi:citrate synthase
VQLGFIALTGHLVGVAAANVLTMFDELTDH